MDVGAMPVGFVIFPVSFVAVVIGVDKFSFSVCGISFPLASVNRVIRPSLFTVTRLLPLQPFPKVKASIFQHHTRKLFWCFPAQSCFNKSLAFLNKRNSIRFRHLISWYQLTKTFKSFVFQRWFLFGFLSLILNILVLVPFSFDYFS